MNKKNIFTFLMIFSIFLLEKKAFCNCIDYLQNYELSKSNEKIQYEDSKRSFIRNYEDKIIKNIDSKSISNIVYDIDKVDNFKIDDGLLPFFYNIGNNIFEDYINNKIVEIFRKIYESKEEEETISTSYDIYEYENIISVVLKFNKKNINNKEEEFLETLNFDKSSLEIINIEDVLGKDYKEKIKRELDIKLSGLEYDELLKEKLKFMILNKEPKFYIKDKKIIIIFDKYLKEYNLKDIEIFKFPYKMNKTVVLNKNKYYRINNIDLIPIGILVKEFDMDIKLNNKSFDIFKDEKLVTKIHLDENKYELGNKIIRISTAPVLVNGIDMSVPFDFFENILNISIIKNADSEIIMQLKDENKS